MTGDAMAGDAMTLVTAWRERARAALEAGDTATASAVLREAASTDPAALQPPTRELGRALGSLAAELIGVPEPGLLEAVFHGTLRILEHAPDARLGDLLTTWNNLAALYDQHGASDHRNHVLGMIGNIAERYEGVVDGESATVFMRMGELFRTQENFPAMRSMYGQVQRFMLEAPDIPDATRSAWLARYASGLSDAGREEEIEPAIAAALAALEARAEAHPLSVSRCAVLLAERCAARGEFARAAELLERMIPLPGLPEAERTEALSWAGRSWYQAGEFDRASRLLVQAVRRRAGLPSGG